MFEEHKEFQAPGDEERLWRYLDLARYIDLLLRKQLFFSRADRFEDPFEGRHNKEGARTSVQKTLEDIRKTSRTRKDIEKAKHIVAKVTERQKEKRTEVTVSSWHSNNFESYAMWKIYAKGSYGIALQTTGSRLKHCFDITDKKIFIGRVHYYDESCDPIPVDHDSFVPFLRKRRIYEYENEVRCCHIPGEERSGNVEWQQQDIYNGVFIPVDLDRLIECIYISPYSPKWISDIVKGINEKFGIGKQIVHSEVFESQEF